MGCTKLFYLIAMAAIGFSAITINYVLEVPPTPILKDELWKYGKSSADTSIKSFKINVSDEILQDLKYRLKTTILPQPLEGVQQQYGFNSKTLRQVIDYWLHEYDWRQQEQYLNQLPQFHTNIQGLNIHYIHVKPFVGKNTPVYPILMLHGWSSSVREFYKIIPLLTKVNKYGFAFEIIVPSLPGFAFSEGSSRPGLGPAEMAIIFKNLMLRIGFNKFYVQGGDWGSIIVRDMATLFSDNILGLHCTMAMSTGRKSILKVILGSIYPSLFIPMEFQHKMYPLSTKLKNMVSESGYFHMQATKPDTLGVGIENSPAGLAAYILEKLSTLTNSDNIEKSDAGLLDTYTYEELIDNIMLYWITRSFTTSIRIYAEAFSQQQLGYNMQQIPIDNKVPCAVARFPHEIVYFPDWILRDKYTNLIHATDFERGGHYPALEVPELLADDIFLAVSKMRNLKDILAY